MLDPEFAGTYNNRGNAYATLGEYEQAIQNYDQAIQLDPTLVFAHANRGRVYTNLGQSEQAIQDLETALELAPDGPTAPQIRSLLAQLRARDNTATLRMTDCPERERDAMRDFKEKVAVVTGAASGIGRGLAEKCCQHRMKVVMADVEAEALWQTEKELKAAGATVLAVQTDVSKLGEIEALAQKTLETYDSVHLLFNNAGVGGGGRPMWVSTQADWEWVLGVNLWSVVHGLRVFVPLMLEQETDCHIVNSASAAGLQYAAPNALYATSKHAVVGLTQQLYFDLAEREANIKVSLLCPGMVRTRILESARNRPAALQGENDPTQLASDAAMEALNEALRQPVEAGMSPQQVADAVFAAIREEKFYILPNMTDFMPSIRERMEDILQDRNPATAS